MQTGEVLRREVFNLLDAAKGGRLKKLKEVNKHEIVEGVTEDYMERRVQTLLSYVKQHSPYYKEHPEWTKLEDFPVMTKGDFIEHYDEVLVEPDVQPLGTVFYLLLFVALGVSLQPELLAQAWLPALALLLARGLSRMGCVLALARLNALGWRQGLALGVAIQPMSGLAMVMAYQANEVYPALGGPLLATLLSAWLLLAILAPLGTRWALRFSGDAQG